MRLAIALTSTYAVTAALLIALRASVSDLDFLSTGWLLLLALVPIAPWLIRALAPTVGRIAPFVQSVTLPGGFSISLRAAARPVAGLGSVEDVLTSDHLISQMTTTAAPFSSTDALTAISGVRAVRASGAAAVVVDLDIGQ
jgi:hypothetical protein